MQQTNQTKANSSGSIISSDVASSVPWIFGSKALLMVVGIGVPLILARSLGPVGLGVLALCRVLSEFLLLVCGLGLTTSILRFVPEMAAQRNLSGITRMLTKSAVLQVSVFALAAAVLIPFRSTVAALFNTEITSFAILALVLTFSGLGREFVSSVFTAMFWARTVAVLSVVQGLFWFLLLLVMLPYYPYVEVAVVVQSIPLLVTTCVGIYLLVKWVSRSDWSRSAYGVGRRRVLNIGLPSVMSGLAGMLLRQHTEIFFLGMYSPGADVGYYELGFGLPLMAIAFLPMTLQQLFTAGFAQSYARDPDCLGSLVKSYFRFLILAVLPISFFGIFFAFDAVPLIYGEPMKPAGLITAFFCGFHTLTLISPPLSLAVVTKEKVLSTLPLVLLQGAVNLTLDLVLIPHYGVVGAAGAVLGTWVLTIPVRLYVVGRLVGGIFFPLGFFVRMTTMLVAVNTLLYLMVPRGTLFELFILVSAYLIMIPLVIRFFRLVRPHEMDEIRGMGFRSLNKSLDFLTGRNPD